MRKQVVLTLILVSGIAYFANAQLISDLYTIYNPISHKVNYSDTSIYSPFGIIKPGKPVYNIAFGAGYTSFGKGMGFSNSTVTPTIAYAPNDKVQIVAGASFSYMNFNNMANLRNSTLSPGASQVSGNPTQAFAYGQYQINNRFSVYAMGSFAKNQYFTSPYFGGIGKGDYQQLGVGFNYKISDKVNFGASVNFTNSNMGYMGLSPNGFNSFSPLFP